MKDCYLPQTHPQADARNCICGKNYRITLLTDKLVRLEYSPDGVMEDRPTQTVWHRDFPPVDYTVKREAEGIVVRTARLQILYDEQPFSPQGLSITLHGYDAAHEGGWHYGDAPRDLKGTARTLDGVDGDQVELEPGLVSRGGFSLLDDSRSLVIGPQGWLTPRKPGVQDLYFFGYGPDYQEAVRDFYRLCGPAPMLPRYALGNWWSRYYPYDAAGYLALMDRFEQEELPFTVAVLDMDWHKVQIDPKYGSGWTGFSWNRDLFPDPEGFLQTLHEKGLRVTLNLHPADGIRAYEDAYPAIAAHRGVDARKGEPVLFDACDPEFLECYYDDVLHPLEAQGVDFWWIDWQQGTRTKMPGLDPLWVLNHYGYLDTGRNGKRALNLSRYAGPGSHRYPLGFSGDTIVTWDSLAFQPYFTATASNIGYCWWSHDIGGHMRGCKDDELMARWTQFGAFSPILRLHSSCSEFCGKEPWRYKPEAARAMKLALQFRHRMLPYLYTMNHRCWHDKIPLILPLYYGGPAQGERYEYPNEYYFGSELLAAPVTTPRIPGLNVARTDVYLPEGLWYDIFARRAYRGGRAIAAYRDLDHIPVFARAGAILPLTDEISPAAAVSNPTQLHLCVYLGAEGCFTLYEDDNETCRYQTEGGALTPMTLTGGPQTVFSIGAAQGETQWLPEKRRYVLEFVGCRDCTAQLTVQAGGRDIPAEIAYDGAARTLRVTLDGQPTDTGITVSLGADAAAPGNDIRGEVFRFLDQAEIEFAAKDRIYHAVCAQPDPAQALSALFAMKLSGDLYGALAELLTAY
ncbi:MAG TPA: glycoside hydrolase family 31 protein [Candidatus Gemmiger excrementavium]|uniref:Glycoside hydrolase family 31 protein n=1 Tax=Candidatus Gemmiger excrementavium TaxID=2838608 RepID=A0A9D2JEK4_9FIRM|nr:glycoside hydrolase family 31 protein [Candidatus Gemmiger excrementavium]